MNWQEKITSYFTSQGSTYIVSDEHKLLCDNNLQDLLKKGNCDVYFYKDPIMFRYVYETTLRHTEGMDQFTTLIVIQESQFNQIPYDIYRDANRVTLSLKSIFPKFEGSIVQQCPIGMYQKIYEAHSRCPDMLSGNNTIDFILREVCFIETTMLVDEIGVVKAALKYFEEFSEPLPKIFLNYLSQMVPDVSSDVFSCFSSKDVLVRRLNEQWKVYVNGFLKDQLAEDGRDYFKNYFNDPYIRANLGKYISPIEVFSDTDYEKWMLPGLIVKDANKEYIKTEKKHLFRETYAAFDMAEWTEFASGLGRIKSQLLKIDSLDDEFKAQVAIANSAFEKWMYLKYQDLSTLPSLPKPKMLHQIPWYLERKLENKAALIVMDGMSYTQWYQIQEALAKENWHFDESGVFSWVPTITPVARQSIFSGKVPREYAQSINSTHKEAKFWKEFWVQQGLQDHAIAYQKSLGLKEFEKNDFPFVISPFVKVYGAVIDVIDKFMHGAKQGYRTMTSELDNWLATKYLHNLLELLRNEGFDIYVTADHGNLECQGRGRIFQGVIVESADQRLRIYKSDNIRKQTAIENPDTLIWNNVNLPDDYYVLLAKNNDAFVPKNDRIITHGGIHIEEVIVPFVRIYR